MPDLPPTTGAHADAEGETLEVEASVLLVAGCEWSVAQVAMAGGHTSPKTGLGSSSSEVDSNRVNSIAACSGGSSADDDGRFPVSLVSPSSGLLFLFFFVRFFCSEKLFRTPTKLAIKCPLRNRSIRLVSE